MHSCFDEDVNPPPECEPSDNLMASDNQYCGSMQDTSKSFASCYLSNQEIGNQFYENCVFDFCANKVRDGVKKHVNKMSNYK